MKNPIYRTARIRYTYIPMWAQRFVFDREKGMYSIGDNDNEDGAHVCFQAHRHNELEMLHIVGGSMTVETAKGCRTAREGEIYIFSRGEPHYGYITSDTPYVEYCFFTADLSRFGVSVGGMLGASLFGEGASNAVFDSPVCDEELGRMIDSLAFYNDILGGDGGAELAMLGGLYSIMARLSFIGGIRFENTEEDLRQSFAERMNDFISRFYTCDITVEMLREHFPYAPSYFCRLFKKHYGCAFFAYLEKYRVDRAKAILLSGFKMSMGDVAAAVGFGGTQQLSRSFRRVAGMSPSEFVQNTQH